MTDLKPTTVPNQDRPNRGFNEYAERLNGRLAMLGFVLLIAIEYFTGRSLLSFIGLG